MLDSLLNMLDSPTNRKSIAQRDKCRNPNPISSRGGKVRSCTQKAGRLPFAIFRRIVTIKLAAASVVVKMKTDEFRVGKPSPP